MTECALALARMGWTAGATALLALPLRWIFRRLRLPVFTCTALWIAVLLRMVLPVGLVTSSLSLMGWAVPAEQRSAVSVSQAAEEVDPADGAVQAGPENAVQAPAAPSSSAASQENRGVVSARDRTPATDVLAWVWAAGALSLWGYACLSWLGLRKKLSTAVRRGSRNDRLPGRGWWWESECIPTAFVFGLVRPRICVPAGVAGEQLDWVLLHERTHIRMGHHWLKLIFFLALGLHWYNPALWLAWALLVRDLELACDEGVLRRRGDAARAYSAALLALAAPGHSRLLPPGFGESGVAERIRRALRWKRPARWAAALAAVLSAVLVLGLATDPTAESSSAAAEDYPELDLETRSIRFPGDSQWTDLGPLLPAPAVWAQQDLGGRDQYESLDNDTLEQDPSLQAGFVSPLDGWLTFSFSSGSIGPRPDTCIYRTHDGGHTWEEIGFLRGGQDGREDVWFSVSCAAFLNNDRAVLATGLFQGAPVFYTSDGGYTWAEAELPLPDGGSWEGAIFTQDGEDLCLVMRGDGYLTLVSRDGGATWARSDRDPGDFLPEAREGQADPPPDPPAPAETTDPVNAIDDPIQIPMEALPWPAWLESGEEFSPDLYNYYEEPVKLVGFSGDRTAALFAFDQSATGLEGVMLCVGGQRTYWPEVSCPSLPAPCAVPLIYGDYDGDGALELAAQIYQGGGTGVSVWDLHVFEPGAEGWVLSDSLTWQEMQVVETGVLPPGAALGYIVQFQAEGDRLRAEVSVVQGDAPQDDTGTLYCDIAYDGSRLTPANFQYLSH